MNRNKLIDLLIFAFIFLVLISFFEPRYMFSLTTTTGGDTASHYPSAIHLKEVLLPHGKVMGWEHGNYAGFPLFYHYFPLTFLIKVILSLVMPMEIAFKLVSILGTFLLPVCVYWTFRFMKYKFPAPILAATFSLAFLFMEANSMWGGNIPSTLAGESSYSFSFAVLFLFFGSLFAGIRDKNKIVFNAFLVFLIGFSHGFTLVFSGVIAAYFLITRKDFVTNFVYLFKVFALGVLFLAFWLVPFFGNLPWVTSYVTKWYIKSILEVFPVVLMPLIALSVVSFVLNIFDRRTWYFAYVIIMSAILYFLAPKLGMLDIRFVPFIQFYLTVFGASLILIFLKEVKFPQMVPFIVYLMVILWVIPNVSFIKGWIKWNYEGFEQKTTWPLLKDITGHLSKTRQGRVVYEHSPKHNCFGTERVFESLPYLAGRETLEGLYMQSSISSPFVFYIQSEVSKVCSGPFPQYKYTKLNLPASLPHLKLFNVVQYIARSDPAKHQARVVPEFKLEAKFEDYEIYRITNHDGSYVVPLEYWPVLYETDNWKRDFFEWFRRADLLHIPLVYLKDPTAKDLKRFPWKGKNLLYLPSVKLLASDYTIEEKFGPETIEFTTSLVGHPHLIKVSYHPNWQVEGADKVYLVSPSFMLVYPEQQHVKLRFSKNWHNTLGELLTLLGLTIVLVPAIISRIHVRKT